MKKIKKIKKKSARARRIQALTSEAVKAFKRNSEKFNRLMEEMEQEFLSDQDGFNSQYKKIVKETHQQLRELMEDKEKGWNEKLQSWEDTMNGFLKETEEMRMKAFETGREAMKYVTVMNLYKLLENSEVEPLELYLAMRGILSRFHTWATAHNNYLLTHNCETLIKRIEALMKNV